MLSTRLMTRYRTGSRRRSLQFSGSPRKVSMEPCLHVLSSKDTPCQAEVLMLPCPCFSPSSFYSLTVTVSVNELGQGGERLSRPSMSPTWVGYRCVGYRCRGEYHWKDLAEGFPKIGLPRSMSFPLWRYRAVKKCPYLSPTRTGVASDALRCPSWPSMHRLNAHTAVRCTHDWRPT